MSCLVTGANGFIGSALVARLCARGEAVRCLVRPRGDRARLEPLLRRSNRATVVVGGLDSPQAASEALGDARCVYHLAARLRGPLPELVANTVVTTKHLLEAIRRRPDPPKLVLVSSFSVYGVAGLPAGAVVDESTPIEPHPELRDGYAFAKHRQEVLCRDFARRHGLALVLVRPGVVYGPGGPLLSSRVGVQIGPIFLHLGGDNILPLCFVDNCAEAIALSGERGVAGQAYNVHDDDLLTAREYLAAYRRAVQPLRVLSVPYPLLRLGSRWVESYHHGSRGQLPALFTPYKTASSYKPQRYDNRKLRRELGWRQLVPTAVALQRTFEAAARSQAAGGDRGRGHQVRGPERLRGADSGSGSSSGSRECPVG